MRVRVGLKEGSLARAIGLGSGLGLGLGSDVCQGGGDRIVDSESGLFAFSSGGREV